MRASKPVELPADLVTANRLVLQKDPTMILYQEHPWNVGDPPACARQTSLTPKELAALLPIPEEIPWHTCRTHHRRACRLVPYRHGRRTCRSHADAHVG